MAKVRTSLFVFLFVAAFLSEFNQLIRLLSISMRIKCECEQISERRRHSTEPDVRM